MRRRNFVALLGLGTARSLVAFAEQPLLTVVAFVNLSCAIALTSVSAVAQPSGSVRQIDVVMALAVDDPDAGPRVEVFEQALQKLGWRKGANIHLEYRWPGSSDGNRIRSSAREIVSLRPDVILAHATPALAALRQETSSIPIIFVQVTDPVSRGLINSLARPGGNITGFTNFEFSMGGKWAELLREIDPSAARVAVLFNPRTAPYGGQFFEQIRNSSTSLGMEASEARVHEIADIERAISRIGSEANGGLIVLPDTFTALHRDLIIALANRHRLPTVYPFRYFVTRSGLASYGVDAYDLFRRAAGYVDRILNGERAADLPVQAPTKYELVVNLKTARALDLTVAPSILARADEVIE